MSEIRCQICGTENPQGSEFCQSCGTRLARRPGLNIDSSTIDEKTEQLSGEMIINSIDHQTSRNDGPRDEVADQSQEKDSKEDLSRSSNQEDASDDGPGTSSPRNSLLDESVVQSDKPEKTDAEEEGSVLSSEMPASRHSDETDVPAWSVTEGENLHEDELEGSLEDLSDQYEGEGINEKDNQDNGGELEAGSEYETEDKSEEVTAEVTPKGDATKLIEEISTEETSLESRESNPLAITSESGDEVAASEPSLKSQGLASNEEDGVIGLRDQNNLESADHAAKENGDWVYEYGTFHADQGSVDIKDADEKGANLSEEEEIQPRETSEDKISQEIEPPTHQPGVDQSTARSWSDWEKILPNESMPEGQVSTEEKEESKGILETGKTEGVASIEEVEKKPDLAEDLPAGLPAEDHGPLADMNGILPGGENIDFRTVPLVYSRTLHLSDTQRIQMGLLENILAEEEQPRPYIPQRTRKTNRLTQLILTMVIMILLTLPISLNVHLLALPGMIPVITNDFYTIVENTLAKPGSQILIAAEYVPGFAGEIGAASLPVIDQLMEKDAYLTIISTDPAGPALAQSLLAQSHQRHPDYSLEQNTLNLGYLAGNANALQQFALQPQQAASYALNSINMWDTHPSLMNITKVGDYDLIIVLTNDIDKARLWIEQVQPLYADDIKLLIVASAQTAPVLSPYIDSGQIEGMIAGYAGGVAYEQLTQASIKGRIYWDSYQTGIALTVILVFLGAFYQVFNSILGRRKKGRRV